MLAGCEKTQDPFLSTLQKGYEEKLSDTLLGKARGVAWNRLLEQGLPKRSDESFRHVALHELYAATYQHPKDFQVTPDQIEKEILPECANSALVFVNGRFSVELSKTEGISKSIVVQNLSDALITYGSFLQNRWTEQEKEEDPFALLNMAAHEEGLFLYLPPNCVCEAPVQFLHLITEEGLLVQPRQQIVVGSSAQIKIITTHSVVSSWTNHAMDIAQGENSHVKLVQATPLISESSWHTDSLCVHLKKDAVLDQCTLTSGALAHRSRHVVVIDGPGASGNLSALTACYGRKTSHADILMDHRAPHCPSRQLFKTALADQSHATFEGKIFVHKEAQKTDAFQLNNNIILDKKARADSKPNLEIFADDVKASHGATVGQLDSESLFYMKTRGIKEEDARQILLLAYANEIIADLPLDSLKKLAREMIQRLG